MSNMEVQPRSAGLTGEWKPSGRCNPRVVVPEEGLDEAFRAIIAAVYKSTGGNLKAPIDEEEERVNSTMFGNKRAGDVLEEERAKKAARERAAAGEESEEEEDWEPGFAEAAEAGLEYPHALQCAGGIAALLLQGRPRGSDWNPLAVRVTGRGKAVSAALVKAKTNVAECLGAEEKAMRALSKFTFKRMKDACNLLRMCDPIGLAVQWLVSGKNGAVPRLLCQDARGRLFDAIVAGSGKDVEEVKCVGDHLQDCPAQDLVHCGFEQATDAVRKLLWSVWSDLHANVQTLDGMLRSGGLLRGGSVEGDPYRLNDQARAMVSGIMRRWLSGMYPAGDLLTDMLHLGVRSGAWTGVGLVVALDLAGLPGAVDLLSDLITPAEVATARGKVLGPVVRRVPVPSGVGGNAGAWMREIEAKLRVRGDTGVSATDLAAVAKYCRESTEQYDRVLDFNPGKGACAEEALGWVAAFEWALAGASSHARKSSCFQRHVLSLRVAESRVKSNERFRRRSPPPRL